MNGNHYQSIKQVSNQKEQDQQKNLKSNQSKIELADQDMIIQSQSSQPESLRAVAFPLDYQQCLSQDKEVFDYIKFVREQAAQIKSSNKKNKKVKLQQKNQPFIQVQEQLLEKKWFSQWKKETLENWKCVIKNAQYLITNCRSQQIQYPNSVIPQIYELYKLPLDKIEQLIIKYSQLYQSKQILKSQYYLWIYSLLAIHQCRANYTNFQALGLINGCLMSEQTINSEALVIVVILVQYFRQLHIVKLYKGIQ